MIITLILQMGKLGFGEEKSLALVTQMARSEPGRRKWGGGGAFQVEGTEGIAVLEAGRGWGSGAVGRGDSRKFGQSISEQRSVVRAGAGESARALRTCLVTGAAGSHRWY